MDNEQKETQNAHNLYEKSSSYEQSSDETVVQGLRADETSDTERIFVQDIARGVFSLVKEKAQATVKKIGDADVTDIVNAIKGFNPTSTADTGDKYSTSNTAEVMSNFGAKATDIAERFNKAAGEAIKRLDLTAVRGIVGESIKDTVKITSYKIKESGKKILFRLLKIWLVWLGISFLIGNIIGGGEAVLFIVLSFFILAIYSVISTLLRLRMSSINIAMTIPSELATRISTDLLNILPELAYENTGIRAEMINSILNKINEILYNPISLAYNPKQVMVLTHEISNVVREVTVRASKYVVGNVRG